MSWPVSEVTRHTLMNPKWWLDGFHHFAKREAALPFNSYVAVLAMWSGISGLFGWSLSAVAFNASLSPDLAALFNVMYLVAGVLIFLGIGWDSPHFEGFGLVLLATSVVTRAIASAALLGLTDSLAVGIVANAALLIPACAIRFRALWMGEDAPIHTDQKVITSVKELLASDEQNE